MDISVYNNCMIRLAEDHIKINEYGALEVNADVFIKANMSDKEIKDFIYQIFDMLIEDQNDEHPYTEASFTNFLGEKFLSYIDDYEFNCFGGDSIWEVTVYYKNSIIYVWGNAFEGYIHLSYEGNKIEEESIE